MVKSISLFDFLDCHDRLRRVFGRIKQPLKWITDFRMVLWVNLGEERLFVKNLF